MKDTNLILEYVKTYLCVHKITETHLDTNKITNQNLVNWYNVKFSTT